MTNGNRRGTIRGLIGCCALVCAAILAVGLFSAVRAETIYSYIDDQGNPVYTNTPETIPDKYRAKVRRHERPDPVVPAPSVMESVKQTVTERAKNLGDKAPSFLGIDGLNPAQSRILTYAGAAAVVLMVMMYLSKSQLVRMLGFSLLIVVGIGAPVLMYVSDGGPMETMKTKATAAGQAQQERVDQISR